MNSGSRQSCTQDCICLGLCASEEERFACILRFGRKLVSVYKLTLPLVAACSCACVIRLSRAHCKTTRSNAKATNDLHSHMTHHMASHTKYSKGTPQYRNGILTSDVFWSNPAAHGSAACASVRSLDVRERNGWRDLNVVRRSDRLVMHFVHRNWSDAVCRLAVP